MSPSIPPVIGRMSVWLPHAIGQPPGFLGCRSVVNRVMVAGDGAGQGVDVQAGWCWQDGWRNRRWWSRHHAGELAVAPAADH
jgi:hypothetical protein